MESIWSVCHLDAGWVVVDHVEDVDQAEQDGDQQTHPASNNLPRAKLMKSGLLKTTIWWKVKLLMSSNTSTSLALAWPWVLIYMLICMSHKHQELPKKWPKQPWKTKPHKINELRSRNKWFKITSGSENSCAIWCRVFFNPSSPFQMPK